MSKCIDASLAQHHNELGWRPGLARDARHSSLLRGSGHVFKSRIPYRISGPVFVVKVPPFFWIHGKAFRFHGLAQELTTARLIGRAAGVIGKGTRGHLVISAGHVHGAASLAVIHGEVNGAATIVA